MEGLFGAILLIILSLVLLIPFGIAVIYFYISLRQLLTGAKEHSRIKQKGGFIAFLISFIALAAILYVWLEIWVFGWD